MYVWAILIFLNSELVIVISVLKRFYLSKDMGGNSRPGSDLGSRMSVFSDDQEERKIPIFEHQDRRMKQLAVKAEERNETSAREGIYTASLMYLKIEWI